MIARHIFFPVFLVLLATPLAADTGRFGNAVNLQKTPLRTKSLPVYAGTPLSIEFWLKAKNAKKDKHFLLLTHRKPGEAGHWEIYTAHKSGEVVVRVSDTKPNVLRSVIPVVDNKWHHVACVIEEKQLRIFVDARQVAAMPVAKTGAKKPTEGELFVGAEGKDAKSAGDVWLDELRISRGVVIPKALPSRAPVADARTLGLWRFDEQKGTRRGDLSKHSNSLAYSPGIASAWTPRSSTRDDAEPWERENDDDWHDDRFNKIDTGNFLGLSMSVPNLVGKGATFVPKGMVIRVGEKRSGTVLFDRGKLQLVGSWSGGFVTIPSRRFGLIARPQMKGKLIFSTRSEPGYAKPTGVQAKAPSPIEPLPRKWGRFLGLYRDGKRTTLRYEIGGVDVLDQPWLVESKRDAVLKRSLRIAAAKQPLKLHLLAGPGVKKATLRGSQLTIPIGKEVLTVQLLADNWKFERNGERIVVVIPASNKPQSGVIAMQRQPFAETPDVKPLVQPTKFNVAGPAQWKQQLTTTGKLGKTAGPFAVDTLTLPHKNPWNSIFYVTGVGFLKPDTAAISTIYGDVWIVSGIDKSLKQLKWKRFATGMHQPLGLVIKNGKIIVLERGQLTRLHDTNGDGEADYYECYYNGWQTVGAGHAYDTALKMGPDGSCYFFKGQAAGNCTESGTLIRVFPDAKGHEVFSTGFRHPIGLGVDENGFVTGADQQGNWMPATRVDRYRKGSFHGDMRTHHRAVPPKSYDPPICWLPQDVDNSAGGQVRVPKDVWGPLSGKLLHFSWGRCRAHVLFYHEVDGIPQGGVVRLPHAKFLSGSITGTFGPDKHLYVAGLHGWQTAGAADGCLQRVRHTGKQLRIPVDLRIRKNAIELQFAQPLDAKSASTNAIAIEQWNYRWSAAYGSDHWSVKNPNQKGHDVVKIERAVVSRDGKMLTLQFAELKPVMQMKISYRLRFANGETVVDQVHLTINRVPGK